MDIIEYEIVRIQDGMTKGKGNATKTNAWFYWYPLFPIGILNSIIDNRMNRIVREMVSAKQRQP